MKKSPAPKKSPKASKRSTKKATAKKAKKPTAKAGAGKASSKKRPARSRRSTARQEMAAFAFDPRLTPCGCCPGALGMGMCGPQAEAKRGGKRKK